MGLRDEPGVSLPLSGRRFLSILMWDNAHEDHMFLVISIDKHV